MQILDTLRQAQGGGAVGNIARAFGADPQQTDAALASILPELTRALERNTLSRGGLADVVKALATGGHERYLDDPTALGDPGVRDTGNAILNHLLGEKHKSRGVAARASTASGLDEEVIKQMLPYVATMAMGGLARQSRAGFGDILSKIPNLGGGASGGGMEQGFPLPGPGQWPQQAPWPQQQGGSGTMEQGGYGNTGGGIGNQMPLPVPGDLPRGGYGGGYGGGQPQPQGRNPIEDLSDILRRGGGAGGMGGGMLWNIVRGILGGAAGFNTGGGFMGWVVRAVIMRYGWSILRTVLGRVFMGR